MQPFECHFLDSIFEALPQRFKDEIRRENRDRSSGSNRKGILSESLIVKYARRQNKYCRCNECEQLHLVLLREGTSAFKHLAGAKSNGSRQRCTVWPLD